LRPTTAAQLSRCAACHDPRGAVGDLVDLGSASSKD
jgi:hypothetical protein